MRRRRDPADAHTGTGRRLAVFVGAVLAVVGLAAVAVGAALQSSEPKERIQCAEGLRKVVGHGLIDPQNVTGTKTPEGAAGRLIPGELQTVELDGVTLVGNDQAQAEVQYFPPSPRAPGGWAVTEIARCESPPEPGAGPINVGGEG